MDRAVLAQRLDRIKKEIAPAKLIAVTKYSTFEDILMAYQLGQRDFGENRVQDLEMKAKQAASFKLTDIRWHMIGHLQTNKIKALLKIPQLEAIHSVDSQEHFAKICAGLQNSPRTELHPIHLFIQVNPFKEKQKSGFESLEDLAQSLSFLEQHPIPALKWQGLMAMGPTPQGELETEESKKNWETETKKLFQTVKSWQVECQKRWPSISPWELSMGMSQDYSWALECGTNYVRIGSSIFGP